MSLRCFALLTLMSLPLVGIGCSPPEAGNFVDGVRTKKLSPEAAAEVRAVVDENFGTPHGLVASLELPVKFGEFRGTVLAAPEGSSLEPYQIHVEFETAGVTAEAITDLGLVWKSGGYTEAVYTVERDDKKAGLTKGSEVNADFRVIGYSPDDGVLSLNYNIDKDSPLQTGDTFVVYGHRLRDGRSLYMQHCMHCHGYSGDGNGPTAKYLNPLPRDYRLGIFKFTSTIRPDKASRDDLTRIVKNGIPGTYMPSFLLMDDDELAAILEYVRWLAMRGEFEQIIGNGMEFTPKEWQSIKASANADYKRAMDRWKKRPRNRPEPKLADFTPSGVLQQYMAEEMPTQVETAISILERNWSQVDATATKEKRVVRPLIKRVTPNAASIARGRALFLSTATNCWTCHGKSGEGNGPQTTAFQKNLKAGGEYPTPGLHDDWGRKIKPRDLTRGIYRGGRRPIDLYRRVKIGIKGTPMPSFGALKDQEIWDIVNYVLSVPVADSRASNSSTESSGKVVSK